MADWHPDSRDAALQMMNTWNTVFADKAAAWNIPQAHTTQLAD